MLNFCDYEIRVYNCMLEGSHTYYNKNKDDKFKFFKIGVMFMSNFCNYNIKVYGTKENVLEFSKIIQADYNTTEGTCTADRHMWRIFEALCGDLNKVCEDLYLMEIDGYCAWSLYNCMLEGSHTYYSEYKDDPFNTSLIKESEILNLYIEATSQEAGVGFAEHYRIFNGKMLLEDEKDYHELYFEDQASLDEFNEENNTNYSFSDIDDLNIAWSEEDYEETRNIINLFK